MKGFLQFAAIGAMLSAVTTFLLWLLPKFYPEISTFDDQVALHTNGFYLGRLWINFIHIFFAVTGYAGVAVILFREKPGFALLGLIAFLGWGFTELLGVSGLIWAVNGTWRSAYSTADEATQAVLSQQIESFTSLWDAWFFLLLVFFLIGTLCYGLGLWRSAGLAQWVSILLLLAVPLTIFIMISGYGGPAWPGLVASWVYPALQPLSRLMLGWWIWRMSYQPSRLHG